jgi:hypothetical protein
MGSYEWWTIPSDIEIDFNEWGQVTNGKNKFMNLFFKSNEWKRTTSKTPPRLSLIDKTKLQVETRSLNGYTTTPCGRIGYGTAS